MLLIKIVCIEKELFHFKVLSQKREKNEIFHLNEGIIKNKKCNEGLSTFTTNRPWPVSMIEMSMMRPGNEKHKNDIYLLNEHFLR